MTDKKEPRSLEEVKRLLRSLEEAPADAEPVPPPLPVSKPEASPAAEALREPPIIPVTPMIPVAQPPQAVPAAAPPPTARRSSGGALLGGAAVLAAVGGLAGAAVWTTMPARHAGTPASAVSPVTNPKAGVATVAPSSASSATDVASVGPGASRVADAAPDGRAAATSQSSGRNAERQSAGKASPHDVPPVVTIRANEPPPPSVAGRPATAASAALTATSTGASDTARAAISPDPVAERKAKQLAQASPERSGPAISAVPPPAAEMPRGGVLPQPGALPAEPRPPVMLPGQSGPSTAPAAAPSPAVAPAGAQSPAPPAPAATPAPSAPAAAPRMSDPVRIDDAEVQKLLADGKAQLAAGQVAIARLLFQRAANAGNGEAARLLGDTYDPAKLFAMGVRGTAGDMEKAIYWYERADELGDPQAKARLAPLGSR